MKSTAPMYVEGHTDGLSAGFTAGYDEGYRTGYRDALQQVTTVQERFPLVDVPDNQMSFLS